MIVTCHKDAVDRARATHARCPLTAELGSVNHPRSLEDGRLALRILDQFSVGVVLVDQSARVLFANAAAHSLSEQGGPLRLNSGVADFSSKHARRLCKVIRSVLQGSLVRTMCIPSSSERSLLVLAAPVNGDKLDRSDFSPRRSAAAILFICDPGRPTHVPVAWLTDAYGLTLAQARVARAVSSGTTIADTAQRLCVSPNTVKTHLRRVYEKTGTSRQAELVRLMTIIGLVPHQSLPLSAVQRVAVSRKSL